MPQEYRVRDCRNAPEQSPQNAAATQDMELDVENSDRRNSDTPRMSSPHRLKQTIRGSIISINDSSTFVEVTALTHFYMHNKDRMTNIGLFWLPMVMMQQHNQIDHKKFTFVLHLHAYSISESQT